MAFAPRFPLRGLHVVLGCATLALGFAIAASFTGSLGLVVGAPDVRIDPPLDFAAGTLVPVAFETGAAD
jgi:hypothetical protein